jgi:hypothetical protein
VLGTAIADGIGDVVEATIDVGDGGPVSCGELLLVGRTVKFMVLVGTNVSD